jgi:hypothetical protein
MALDRLYRENVRIDLAYPEAFVNPYQPTTTELNNATFVKNITCALDEDSTEFTLGDPDTDDSLSFCDAAGSSSATFDNPTLTLTAYSDEDRSASGVYDLATQLIGYPDIPFYGIMRLGFRSDVAYAVGQDIRIIGARTDLPVSLEESGENARLQNSMLPDGTVSWNYRLLT